MKAFYGTAEHCHLIAHLEYSEYMRFQLVSCSVIHIICPFERPSNYGRDPMYPWLSFCGSYTNRYGGHDSVGLSQLPIQARFCRSCVRTAKHLMERNAYLLTERQREFMTELLILLRHCIWSESAQAFLSPGLSKILFDLAGESETVVGGQRSVAES